MKNIITEFFQHIYEVTRMETPEFMIHSWQDKVAWAFLNPTDPAAQAIMLKEGAYVAQRKALTDTYEKVVSTVELMPEGLKGAALVVVSSQVPATLVQLGLSEKIQGEVMSELNGILSSVEHTPEGVQQVAAMLAEKAKAEER